jgi:hypothetical protein
MFKSHIANDIERTFLNLSEFADEAVIDGEKIKVVIDTEARTYESNVEEMERTVGNILIFVSKKTWEETYGTLPEAYDAINFNGRPCTIARAHERNGMLSLTLDYGS